MAKLFCISDVHGYYDEMREALDEAEFDPNNENHWLVSCGDHLDRGRQPRQVMHYLKSLPRKILVKGNHEQLLMDCIERAYPYEYDWSNGTEQTILDLAPSAIDFDEACSLIYWPISKFVDSMVNYFETKNYIFVHGFVPLKCDSTLPPYYLRSKSYTKMENWREAHQHQWDDAAWLNSYDMIDQGIEIGKCIVAGHWHSSYGRYKMHGTLEFGPEADFSPFYYDDKLIMIDACTAYSGKVNCLVLEDEFLTAQN